MTAAPVTAAPVGVEPALTLYADGLADAGRPDDLGDGPWYLCYDDGRRSPLHLDGWCSDHLPGDTSLISRCSGPTLDVGCGPGRLAAAVSRHGLPVLGLDISPAAVRIARDRGALVVQRSVFEKLPAEGSWHHVLLADGNVGIGGDPARLLRRCADLLDEGGDVFTEVDPPGTGSSTDVVRIESATGRCSEEFPWAHLSMDDTDRVAAVAGLVVTEKWTEAGRWFATMRRY